MATSGDISVPGFSDPEPSMITKANIFALAEEMVHGLDYSPGADLEPILSRMGGCIRERTGREADETGSIRVHGPRDFTIFLSPFIGERRRRFTIAHEMGHYVLHSEFGKKRIRVKREGSNRVEWEANWFASGFLMPTEEFRSKHSAGWTVGMLADYFKVSEAAVEIRMESIEG